MMTAVDHSAPEVAVAGRGKVRVAAGVPVRIDADSAALLEHSREWLADAFVLADGVAGPRQPLGLRVSTGGSGLPPPPDGAIELAASAAWRVLRDDQRVFLSFPCARCDLDLAAGHAEIHLGQAWWSEPLKAQQDPWLLSLVWLLRERGRYAFHASAVARGGRGLLIAGESGSGKSSTALSLIHRGWDWLADDVVLLESGEEPTLHGLARGFAFHPTLAERLRGLEGESVAEKRFAAVDGLSSGRQIPRCRPVALLFPQVTRSDASRIESLSLVESLTTLLPASGGILAGGAPEKSQEQLTALSALVRVVPAYRLYAGRDIFGDGAALEALLEAHGIDVGGGEHRFASTNRRSQIAVGDAPASPRRSCATG